MSLLFTQRYVADMCESVDVMKITDRQKDFVRAAFRAAIEYANAKNGMHASQNAKEAALSISSPDRPTDKYVVDDPWCRPAALLDSRPLRGGK